MVLVLSLFCNVGFSAPSNLVIMLLRKRELIALL